MVELIKVIVACKQWVKERTFTVIYMIVYFAFEMKVGHHDKKCQN